MIHPTAIIDESAKLGVNVTVGPWSFIGANVEIGDDCVIEPHVVIKGHTQIGKRNRIFQFSSIGEDCQDKKYDGEETWLYIGDDNEIREHCTIHRGTAQDESKTVIGHRNLIMVNTHVAHDCVLGNDIIIANNTGLAGHVTVGDGAIFGGGTLVHQFCNVGEYCFTGGGSIVMKDIAAYVLIGGNPTKTFGLNIEGMKRRGYSKELISALKLAYRIVFRKGFTTDEALAMLVEQENHFSEVKVFCDSIRKATRGLIR